MKLHLDSGWPDFVIYGRESHFTDPEHVTGGDVELDVLTFLNDNHISNVVPSTKKPKAGEL